MRYSELSEEKKELAKEKGYQPLFASRETAEEAVKYFEMILESLNPAEKLAVITGYHVLRNTEILLNLEG